MPYQDVFTNHLNDIIELIRANKILGENEALQRFNTYTETIQAIGQFDLASWRLDWRKKVWAFGLEFKKLTPHYFIKSIDEKLLQTETQNKEVLEFIRSEIIVNFLPDNECKKQLELLIEKYPLNPEFRHTLGHYYAKEKNFLSAITVYNLAIKIEPNNSIYIRHRFTTEHQYLSDLIAIGEYQKAKDYLQEVFLESPYQSEPNYHNSLIDFNARLDDHLFFQTKLKKLENEFKEKMQNDLEGERKRIIEVLGFFSAIVAFILSTVSIGKNFSFIEATYFIVALGIILILFTISLTTLFTTNKTNLFKDKKFWILVTGLILLLLYIIMTNSIASLLQKLTD